MERDRKNMSLSIFEDIKNIENVEGNIKSNFINMVCEATNDILQPNLCIANMASELRNTKTICEQFLLLDLVTKRKYSKVNSTYKTIEEIMYNSITSDALNAMVRILFFFYILNKKYFNKYPGSRIPINTNEVEASIAKAFDVNSKEIYESFNDTIFRNGQLWKEDKLMESMKDFITREPNKEIKKVVKVCDIKEKNKEKENLSEDIVVSIGGGTGVYRTKRRRPPRDATIITD